MEYVVLFGLFFTLFPSVSHGFLVYDKTTSVPNLNHVITTKEFNDLVILVSSERTARLKLEQKVIQMENELQQTQQALTDVYYDNQRLNASMADQNNLITSLSSENAALKFKYDALILVNKELAINLTRTETELNSVKNRMSQLEQMKTVSELQLVLTLQNDTKYLQDELKSTNAKVDRVSNENNARKDDIIALYNTVNNNENKFISYAKNTSEVINRTSYDIVEKISKNINALSQHQNQTAEQLTQKIVHLDQTLNVTFNMIDRELHNMSGRVVLTSCASSRTYSSESKIVFPDVKTSYGVSNSVISELGTAGNYRVEYNGVYLISAYILTNVRVRYTVYVNNDAVAYIYSYINDYATAAFTLSKHLRRKDLISIRVNDNDKHIDGGRHSCLTILQLTKD